MWRQVSDDDDDDDSVVDDDDGDCDDDDDDDDDDEEDSVMEMNLQCQIDTTLCFGVGRFLLFL